MSLAQKPIYQGRKGTALIISMVFIIVFSALAVGMATVCDTNVQIANNHRKGEHTRACAESGLEIMRFWLSRVSIYGDTPAAERLDRIVEALQNDLTISGITNITTSYSSSTLTVPSVTLDSAQGKSFCATITQIDDDTVRMDVTGEYGSITRTIRVNCQFVRRAHSVFDFGVATKGPLSLSGNIELTGVNVSVESDVYIESENSNLALSITGNSQIAGDVSIVNPTATVDLQGGQAGIGGETGQAAVDNHVTFGAPSTEFPVPNPGYFEPYTVNIVDADTDTSAGATFENIRILANTNPTFNGHVTLRGIVFIETPNIVTFAGTADITGIVVGDGDPTDNSGTNQIIFTGDVESTAVSELPNEQEFAEIREDTGTFVMAPGFHVSFGGSFDTLNGAIVGNGIEFHGNAGGIVNGSIVNYSDEAMTLSGNSDLFFNRSGLDEVPAGFVPELILKYSPSSYSEIAL